MRRNPGSRDGRGEGPVQPPQPSAGSRSKAKLGKRLCSPRSPVPRLTNYVHFHHKNVDLGHIELRLVPEPESSKVPGDNKAVFEIQVTCLGRSWTVLRSYEDFLFLDGHLHRCVFDCCFSHLPELPPAPEGSRPQELVPLLLPYLEALSRLLDRTRFYCGLMLMWMGLDNRGRRLLLGEGASLHVLAGAVAQAWDELSLEVGDNGSGVDMQPTEDAGWWQGNQGRQVGFLPTESTEGPDVGGKADPDGPTSSIPASLKEDPASLTIVSRPRGKLARFFRFFFLSSPAHQRRNRRVFGRDLGEHLRNSDHDVPQVLRCCSEFIETHGVTDGIYRLSGISSNVQKLRREFDKGRIPELSKPAFLQDIHCISSLCKLYFRELPNPLLTYQLYRKFSEAVSVPRDEERLVRMQDVIRQLPPPNYRTLEYLLRHLSWIAQHSADTSMPARNLAIVWGPNLLRPMEADSGPQEAAAFREVQIQSAVVEFLLNHVDVLFK